MVLDSLSAQASPLVWMRLNKRQPPAELSPHIDQHQEPVLRSNFHDGCGIQRAHRGLGCAGGDGIHCADRDSLTNSDSKRECFAHRDSQPDFNAKSDTFTYANCNCIAQSDTDSNCELNGVSDEHSNSLAHANAIPLPGTRNVPLEAYSVRCRDAGVV